MSIQRTLDPLVVRRERRVTSHCEIWDMLAPDVPCPACNPGFTERLEQAHEDRAQQQDGATLTREEARQLLGFLAR